MQEIIAVVFDFDDTLAPDSTSGFLERHGVDVPAFWREEVQPLLDQDWDPVPAFLYRMQEYARAGRLPPLTRAGFEAWGREMALYPGVERIFPLLREQARRINPRVSVEFYLISSGIREILLATPVAGEFHDIWASEFHYADGLAAYPRKIVSFTDKTRYLFHIQKGLFGPQARGQPFDVNRKVKEALLRVPLGNLIFVGDGFTDVPCFSLVKKNGGVAIGVYDQEHKEKWGRAWGFIEDDRVSNLVPADYGPRSALVNFLVMAVESLSRRIQVANTTYQG